VIPGHPFPVVAAHCSMCAHWIACQRYRELWERFLSEKKIGFAGETAPSSAAIEPQCIHLGRALNQLERVQVVPYQPGVWRRCAKGHGTAGFAVRQCCDCGSKCSDYSAE